MSRHIPFSRKLETLQDRNDSLVMVGLDPDFSRIPKIFKEEELPQFAFNRAVIDATKDLCCCYKPQMAFYEEQGLEGYRALAKTLEYIPDHIPVVADGKRNDIGNTCRAYARAFYHGLGVDGVTLNPYLGFESIFPFLYEPHEEGADPGNIYQDRGVFVLARTSNKGSGDIQGMTISAPRDCAGTRVYKRLVELFMEKYGRLGEELATAHGASLAELGFVAGATYPEELKTIRKLVGEETLLLIPGIGAQGGDVEKTIHFGANDEGKGVLINSSRGIIFPDQRNREEKDVDVITGRIREAALSLRDAINEWR